LDYTRVIVIPNAPFQPFLRSPGDDCHPELVSPQADERDLTMRPDQHGSVLEARSCANRMRRRQAAFLAKSDVRSLSCAPFGSQVRDDNQGGKVQNGKSTGNRRDARHNDADHVEVDKTYCVYIVASYRRVLYTGITSHIERRVRQHKSHTPMYQFSKSLSWLMAAL
jgi:hypothetical protein